MVDQVIAAHPDSLYFHVGLDEVYYKLMHPNCSQTTFNGDFTQAFLSHLTKVAAHVRSKLPKAKILVWDNMLHNMDESVMIAFKPKINEYEIEPMIWAYMEDPALFVCQVRSHIYECMGGVGVQGRVWRAHHCDQHSAPLLEPLDMDRRDSGEAAWWDC